MDIETAHAAGKNFSSYKIPRAGIEGYERHFVRGFLEEHGIIHFLQKKGTRCKVVIRHEDVGILEAVVDLINEKLFTEKKKIITKPGREYYLIQWHGLMARFLIWWLYGGDIGLFYNEYYKDNYNMRFLKNERYETLEKELMAALKARIGENNVIYFRLPARYSQGWVLRIQKLLSFKTQPVKLGSYHYGLYVVDRDQIE